MKGAQGDTGVNADYPIAIVNNLTTNDPASALSAAQGVVLDGKVTQLEAEVDELEEVGDILIQNKTLEIITARNFVWDANTSTAVGATITTKSEGAYNQSNAIPVKEGDRFNIGVRKYKNYYHIIFVDEDFGFISGDVISGADSALVYH